MVQLVQFSNFELQTLPPLPPSPPAHHDHNYTVRGQVRVRSGHILQTLNLNLEVRSTKTGPGPGPPQTGSRRSSPGLVQVRTQSLFI